MSTESAQPEPVEPVAAPATPQAPSRTRWLVIALDIVFGLVFAYYLWDAIRSVIVLPAAYENAGFERADAPWAALFAGVLAPVAIYATAFLLGLRHRLGGKALLFVGALVTLACVSISINTIGTLV
jgi:hypothetical protein